jgi:predicted nucleic-acid-binding Zn-ribbon protein
VCKAPQAMFKRKPVIAEVAGRQVTCLICGANEFVDRPIQLNTAGMELFDLSWANRAATGLICTTCGYVHEFVGSELQLYDAG